jgi:hypothetical protein
MDLLQTTICDDTARTGEMQVAREVSGPVLNVSSVMLYTVHRLNGPKIP